MTIRGPVLKLNDGADIPAVGLGVYRTPPFDTIAAVRTALETGYRHIDTAAAYRNEAEVGQAIRDSGIPRDQIFLESKLWLSDFGYDVALAGFERSASRLGVEVIDLYLLHQPGVAAFDKTIGAWKRLEELQAAGRVRSIGVSNFLPAHLDRLMDTARAVPAVNQIELHPFFTQRQARAKHAELGILTQAWSPLGGVNRYFTDTPRPEDDPLTHPVLTGIAAAHLKSVAQVMLRWQVQLGHSVIPKSVKPARIAENFDLFDFKLTAGDMQAIEALDTGRRGGPDPDTLPEAYYTMRVD